MQNTKQYKLKEGEALLRKTLFAENFKTYPYGKPKVHCYSCGQYIQLDFDPRQDWKRWKETYCNCGYKLAGSY